jgi:hypothetical protein
VHPMLTIRAMALLVCVHSSSLLCAPTLSSLACTRAGKHKNPVTCGAWGMDGQILALGSMNMLKVN